MFVVWVGAVAVLLVGACVSGIAASVVAVSGVVISLGVFAFLSYWQHDGSLA